jgi:hypothetical protein
MNNLDDNTTNWGIVELMGRKIVAGKISKSELLGAALLRVDVPATSAFGEFTQFYGSDAIYCVTFVSEEVARRTAEQTKVNPVRVYVPDLITREKLDEVVQQYEKSLDKLRALPSGGSGEAAPGVIHRIEKIREEDDDLRPDEDDDDDDD